MEQAAKQNKVHKLKGGQMSTMFKKGAFLSPYSCEGCHSEIGLAKWNVGDLIRDYDYYEKLGIEEQKSEE